MKQGEVKILEKSVQFTTADTEAINIEFPKLGITR